MTTIPDIQSLIDAIFGFVGYEAEPTPAMSAAITTSATAAAKAHLRAAGWSYRTAAARLGVSYQHISYVLNGQRTSRSLLQKLTKLPHNRQPA